MTEIIGRPDIAPNGQRMKAPAQRGTELWPDHHKDPEGWEDAACEHLRKIMCFKRSVTFESVLEERFRIAKECVVLLKDEGKFGNRERLIAIHKREMAARAEHREMLAAQLAKEKAAVAKNEQDKQAALEAAKKEIALTLEQGKAAGLDPTKALNDVLAVLEAEQEPVSPGPDVASTPELNDTPAEDTPIPAEKRYKVVLKDGSKFFGSPVFAGKYAEKYNVNRVIDTWTGEILSIAEALARHTSVTTPEPKPAANDWIDDEKKRAAFWAKARENALKRGFEVGDVEPIMHAANNVVSMRDFPGDGSQAMKAFVAELDQQMAERAPEPAKTNETAAEPPAKAMVENSLPSEPKNGNPEPQRELTVYAPPPPMQPMPKLPEQARWDIMRQQASILIKSGFLPVAINTPEKAIAIMMMGEALNIPYIVALSNINVIQGKPTVPPQLMLGLINRSGQLADMTVTDDGTTCTVTMTRKGKSSHTEKFSQMDAAEMGLSDKGNWQKQPAVMRKWRAISAAARVVFPDVIWGMYLSEELNPD